MARSANQKLKQLYLLKILQEESDENHPVTVAQLITALERHGITAERKSLYDDIEGLCQFGYDVVVERGRCNRYFLGERTFQLAEVKLMVDAIQSAKFITTDKSAELIKKICTLASRHQGTLMQRQIHLQNSAKTVNKRTYYNVDTLHSAIAGNHRVQFKYYQWVVDSTARRLYKNEARRAGQLYEVSPWSLLWDDENYYLVAYDEGAHMIKHYRVDRMDRVVALASPRAGRDAFEELNMAEYSKSVFGMFGGRKTDVRIRFSNRLIGVVIDRFGQDIIIHPEGDSHFTLTARITVSPQFFSWLFGFGKDAQLLGPQAVLDLLHEQLKAIASCY